MSQPVPALVTLDLWGVRRGRVPSAVVAMARDRRPVRRTPGLTFAKLLGTGDGRTFTARDADPHHWGLIATWADIEAADRFESSPVVSRWNARAHERLAVRMTPLSSQGRWSGREPFGRPVAQPYDGPVAAVTRARLRPRLAATFWRAVPPVSLALRRSPGLLLAVGIGEAPIGLQGTFSLWESAEALRGFAHGAPEHREVIRRTRDTGWYAEELFARFAVVRAVGSVGGTRVEVGT